MKHVEVPKIKSFLLGLDSPALGRSLQPPVLEHILKCRTCQKDVQALAGAFDQIPRLTLYPETDCHEDAELRSFGSDPGQSSQPVVRRGHVKACLWCALALHDDLSGPIRALPVESHRQETARMESRRAMRAAVIQSFQGNPRSVYYLGKRRIIWAGRLF